MTGTVTCTLTNTMTSGGITVNTQHMGGMELERQEEVIMALRRGAPLTFNIDFSACSMVGQGRGTWRTLSANASELWASCISVHLVTRVMVPCVQGTVCLTRLRDLWSLPPSSCSQNSGRSLTCVCSPKTRCWSRPMLSPTLPVSRLLWPPSTVRWELQELCMCP
ncbi:hypothetical protein ACOMHN_051044 [Nucella lapillus]